MGGVLRNVGGSHVQVNNAMFPVKKRSIDERLLPMQSGGED